MYKKVLLVFLAVMFAGVIFISCSDDDDGGTSPTNSAPVISSISATASEVVPSGTITLICNSTDVDGDALTYEWFCTDGVITGTSSSVTWTAPATLGTDTITCTVSDGTDTDSETKTITVTDTPNNPPVINSLTANPTSVNSGETSTFTCDATDADIGGVLTYSWSATGGTITGTSSSETWTAPATVGTYTITCTVSDGTDIVSDDESITVTTAPFITVTSPNGGETCEMGTTQTITWEDNIDGNVLIEVYKGGVFYGNITDSTPSDGSYDEVIPTDIDAGTDYKFKITSVADSSIYDFSDNNFTITASAASFITVTYPNGGEIWEAGQTYEITWEDNVDGNVIIEVYKDGVYIDSTAIITESDGSMSMDLPTEMPSFTNLQFKILSEDDPSVFDFSDGEFEIVGNVDEGTGSYNLDGNFVEATRVGLNMDSGIPQMLQINIRNDLESPRHMVQVTTTYTSKLLFDNAFSSNTLVLNNANISNVGMEFDDSFHSFTQNSFSLDVVMNADGTYDFTSSGSISDGIKTVTNITGENVGFDDHNGE